MQGKATFTLTDVKTGRTVKQFTEHNMITDAAQRILDPPDYVLPYNFNYSAYLNNLLPLSRSVFGGIVLLGNTLEERSDNVMWNKDCIPIATAGGAYSGTNVMRGSLNANESYETENGFHFAWDFGTDKANGTIKCAALTSRAFGNSGFTNDDTSSAILLNPQNFMSTTESTMMYEKYEGQYIGTFEKHIHTYFRRHNTGNGMDFIRTKSLDPNFIGVNDKPSLSSYSTPIYRQTVTLPITLSLNLRFFLNQQTRVVYFFENPYNDNGVYKISYAVVSMDDFSIVETGVRIMSNNVGVTYAAAIYDNKLFMLVNGSVQVFKESGEREYILGVNLHPNCCFFTVNGVMCFSDSLGNIYQYIQGKFYPFRNPNGRSIMYSADILPPYYPTTGMPVYSYISDYSQNPVLGLAANFFSTINNLSEPLEKTNEHALKITYDITN